MKLATTAFTYFVKLLKVIYSRPRVMLPAAASNATSGRESMTCMAFLKDFSIEVGWAYKHVGLCFRKQFAASAPANAEKYLSPRRHSNV